MSTPLGLYTTKILSEHPLAVWSLDDQADYVSILDADARDISLWTTESSTLLIEEDTTNDAPILAEKIYKITDTPVTGNETITIRLQGATVGSLATFDEDLATFSISSFINSLGSTISSVTLGISYNDPTYGAYDVYKKFPRLFVNKWMLLSETFDIPQGLDEDYSPFIEIEYLSSAGLDPVEVLVSGYTIGQWAEEFSSSSTGLNPEFLSDSIFGIPSDTKAIRILGAVESTKDGYILANDTRLYARNFGMPLVYGSESSTTLYTNTDLPSILIPGLGFLNSVGQNKNYSIEFWMRINSSTSIPKRIFGPVASSDGLYVDGPFLKLQIGERSKYHFVGEWARPMLIHITISEQEISLLINGESVAIIPVDRSALDLPNEIIDGSQADWLGFYCYEDILPFEINSISTYSYIISNTIAKRRWIYGQAVDNPEALNTAFGGQSIQFDHQFSKYSNGYSYPKTGSWSDGVVNNLNVSGNRLSTLQYELPEIVSATSTQNQILTDNLSLQNEEFNFVRLPQQSSIFFKSLNPLEEKLEAIYATFKVRSSDFSNQTLVLIKDKVSGDYLEIFITPGVIWYSFKFANQLNTFAAGSYPGIGEIFSVGLSLDKVSMYFGSDISKFLSNRNSLELFIAGGSDKNTFLGNIYDIGFLNAFSLDKVSKYFQSNGLMWGSKPINQDVASTYILPATVTNAEFVDGVWTYEELVVNGVVDGGNADTSSWLETYDGGIPLQNETGHAAIDREFSSYSIKIFETQSTTYMDIYSFGSWTTSIPMSYFGKYVLDNDGNRYYDLDFVQFNIGYPAPGSFSRIEETDESWTYQELNLKFSSPTQKRYSDLDNSLYTGYVDYTDLQYNSRQTYRYDTSNALARTYIYFKDVSSGLGNSEKYYSHTTLPAKNGIVSPGTEWINTKYEVVDDMIIYPPTGVDFSTIAMFVEVVTAVDGVSDRMIEIDKLQFSSISLDNSSGTAIGTKFGIDVYPYTKNGFYYDFKSRNPFSMYTGSTPYLYLNKNSGIRVRGDFSGYGSRGIEIPINVEKSPKYKMIALQFFAKFDDDFFPYAPTEIMEIESASGHLKLFMEATHPNGKRAKIYAVNAKTGQIENGIGFYVNGRVVKDAILTVKQWISIGVGLANFIDFSVVGGAVRITGPLTINNISHYNSVNLQQVQITSARQWSKVKQDGMLTLDWEYWEGQFKWFEVLVLASSSFYGVDPSEIYKTYTGTSRVLVDDKTILRTSRYRYRMLSNAITNLFTINSV